MHQQDNHFHMSEDYELNSSSQKTIGRTVIQCAIEMAKLEFGDMQAIKALDIACGPGNLSIEFLHALEESFPNATIDLAASDFHEENVNRLIKKSAGAVKDIRGSFYNLPAQTKKQHIIISNKGLHWQPPCKMSKIFLAYLGPEEKGKYELVALKNLKIGLRNIYKLLKNGGIAVLQLVTRATSKKLGSYLRRF